MSESLKHGRIVDITPCADKSMLDRPNWRYHIKSKWKDNHGLGFKPSYKDFGRKTSNGFHTIKNGVLTEPDGSQAKSLERYNPYINSNFELGHRFRKRISQHEISPDEFSSYISKDIMLKQSMFTSSSIRTIESDSNLKFAKERFEKLAPIHHSFNRNQSIKMDFKTLETDYDFQSPKVYKKAENKATAFQLEFVRTKSEKKINQDLPLIQAASRKTLKIEPQTALFV